MLPLHLNPYSRAVKKYMLEVLQEGYTNQVDETIERAVSGMITKNDSESFIRFLGSIYEAGFNTAMKSAEDAMLRKGYKIKIVPPSDLPG